jgi:hypothetical protein
MLRDETGKNRKIKWEQNLTLKKQSKCLRIKLKIKFNYENEKKIKTTIKRMRTKFDIKIKLNQIMMDGIEEKKRKKEKQQNKLESK